MSRVPAVDARSVWVELDGRTVLEHVSMRVEVGELVCLCGPNGGGKTTFLKAALGLVAPRTGTVALFGGAPASAWPAVGYVPQRTTFDRDFPATVGDLIAANLRGRWPIRLRAAERATALGVLARVGGADLIDRRLARLSGGQAQRAFLARALANKPSLLLLDEPTAGVDAKGRGEFLDLIADVAKAGDVAILMVTHNRAAVDRFATRVVYLDRTVVASGRPDEVFSGGSAEDVALVPRDHLAHAPLCDED